MSEPAHLLVVDDSPTQLAQMRMVLESDGFAVRTASDGLNAISSIDEAMPSVVITDLQMPNMNGLELVEALKQKTPSLPVILTTSQGSEAIAAEALQKGAASYVPKRDMMTWLARTVRQVMSLVMAEQTLREVAKYEVENTVALSLNNDDTLIPSVIARLEKPIIELDLFDEGERMQIAMALDEALTNAIIHGNLEVSSSLRQVDDGKPYVEMIEARKLETPYCDRRVSVRLEAFPDKARFVICDEGPGFDPGKLADPTDPENLEKAGGRGLLLINAFMDVVKHNDAGNGITMIKRRVADGDLTDD
jgi:CheY-like chemotaxis protein/anti-sigma regulatory factor (Ser/Thr protein kinase)